MQENLLLNDEFDFGTTIAYEKPKSPLITGLLPSPRFTTLLYGFNNPDLSMKYVMGDFPRLLLFDYAAKKHDLVELMMLFKKYALELQNNNLSWDPLLFASDILIRPKLKYQAELLRQTCTFSNKVLLITDRSEINLLE